MSDDTPTPPKRRKRVSMVDMSDMEPRPKDPRRGGDPAVYNAWMKVYNKRYKAQNSDKIREGDRLYRERNPEKIREKHQLYYWQNPERARENKRLRYWQNPERAREGKRRWNERNPEKVREGERRWNERNPEKVREKRRRQEPIRRAREKKADIPLTAEERQQVDALYAQRDILTKTTGIKHHVDHIVPLTKGGIHHPINLRVITWVENLSKNAKLTPDAMPLIPLIEALKKERQGWLNSEQGNLRDLFNDETETGT